MSTKGSPNAFNTEIREGALDGGGEGFMSVLERSLARLYSDEKSFNNLLILFPEENMPTKIATKMIKIAMKLLIFIMI